MPATQTAATRTYSRQAPDDRRRFLAAMSRGESSIGWGPQCLVLGRLPAADILALCEAVEAHSEAPNFCMPVQFRAEIARCAKRNGASSTELHVRLTDAVYNSRPEAAQAVAALLLAAATA